jgi:hypothetical protein
MSQFVKVYGFRVGAKGLEYGPKGLFNTRVPNAKCECNL